MAIAPGKSLTYPLTALQYGDRGSHERAYWTQEGEYTLTARYQTAVAPVPNGAEALTGNFDGFGRVTLTSNTVKLKVVKTK